MDLVTISQVAAPILQTVFIAVIGLGYYYTVRATWATVAEMRAEHAAGEAGGVAQGARGAQKEGAGLAFHPHPSRLNFLDLENLQRTISLSPLPNLPRVSSLILPQITRRTRRQPGYPA